jgi:hypothetical protein
MRPDWSRWTAFDGSRAAAQSRIYRLLCLVGFRLRYRCEVAAQRVGATRNHIKPRHRCGERLHSEQRARWGARGNAIANVATVGSTLSIGAVDEGVQAVDGGQQAATRNQAPFDQVATGDFAL